ncbi:olfactory receptor 287-like [Hyperolius riggenbachi]|uniref:olfactory receptor 287-like n=1 Tax=Hyperolius riggenbachi TaxID=752182 RepID=UPI0035A2944E
MKEDNLTQGYKFILLGFSVMQQARVCIFFIIVVIYTITIITNIFIIALVRTERSLHKPMYFFIGGLSFLEIWYPSVTIPKLLLILVTRHNTITLAGCVSQFFFHFSLGAAENFLLAIMAYDRYVAVCIPLRYSAIMDPYLCLKLLIGSWLCGFAIVGFLSAQILNVQFCTHNVIDHYYCDFAPIIRLSCSDTSIIETQFFALSCVVILGCFIIILISYICIIRTTVKLRSTVGRYKILSTCSSHFIVVMLFYGTTIFMFIRPAAEDVFNLNKKISVIPSIVTPLLNPVIYTLRNKQVKEAISKATVKRRNTNKNNSFNLIKY